jgi:FixJ family two-component response regulator
MTLSSIHPAHLGLEKRDGETLAGEAVSRLMPYSSLCNTLHKDGCMVYVVEDDPELRTSISALTASMGVPSKSFASAEEFLAGITPEYSGCAIVDLRLGNVDGLELNRRLQESGHFLPVILFSGYLDVRTTVEALKHGVYHVLEKPCGNQELGDTIRKALAYSRSRREEQLRRSQIQERWRTLTAREIQAAELIFAGYPSKVIENRLELSKRTVDRVRAAILQKMGFDLFVELAAALTEAGALPGRERQTAGAS